MQKISKARKKILDFSEAKYIIRKKNGNGGKLWQRTKRKKAVLTGFMG